MSMVKNRVKMLELLDKKVVKAKMNQLRKNLNTEVINVVINSVDDFYDSYDSKKALSPALDEYIFQKTQIINAPCVLQLNLKVKKDFPLTDEEIKSSVSMYYKEKAVIQLEKNEKEKIKWIRNGLSGMIFLAACLVGAHLFNQAFFDEHSFAKVMSESLGIIGWVAIWEPAEYFLFKRKENNELLIKNMLLHLSDVIVERV